MQHLLNIEINLKQANKQTKPTTHTKQNKLKKKQNPEDIIQAKSNKGIHCL